MPYKSQAQQKKFHELLKAGKIDKKIVDAMDQASAGMKLPERLTEKPKDPPKKK